MSDGAPVDLEALLAHSDWARKVALHLVRDPDRADDLVQETWRKALERPPVENSSAIGLRGWIGTVIRNLAGTRRRDAELRAWHERRAARPESWTPEDVEQRVLLQRRLAEAVLELAEPYRSAITLRYFVGLSTRDVAQRQGVSHDAARQRISRGLSMLHRRLDREFRGGEVAWSSIAAALAFEGAREGWLAPFLKGGLLVSSKAKLVAVAAVIVAVAAVFVVGRTWNDRSGLATSSSEPTQLASSELDPQAPAIPPRNVEDGARLQPERAALSSEQSASGASTASDRDRVLAGRVIGPSGNPVEGAKIVVFRNEMSEYQFLETVHQFDRRTIAETRSDSNGEFAVPVEMGRPFLLETEARGFALERLEHRYAGERVLVRLHRGATVQGFVSRKSDHSPVVAAAIRAYRGAKQGPSDRYYPFEGKTDALGRFEFSGIAPGEVYIRITPEVEAAPEWQRLELIEGKVHEVDVEVDAGPTLRGRVVDAATGEPIAGAEVGVGRDFQRPVRTDSNGEYVYPGFPLVGVGDPDLDVRATGYGKQEKLVRASETDPYPERVDFELARARLARGRVVDTAGNPVASAYVVAAAFLYASHGQSKWDWRSTMTTADGSFRIESLRPDLPHSFLARRDGLGTVIYAFPSDESTRADIDLGDVVLPPMSILRGAVVDEEGNGIPDQTVSLRGRNSDRARWRESGPKRVDAGSTAAAETYLAVREARTDDLGRFSFADVAGGTYTVSTQRRGGHPVSQQIQVENGSTKEGIRLVQPEGKSIEGRVVTYAGKPVSHALVLCQPQDSKVQSGGSTEADSEGRFVLRGLAALPHVLDVQASYWSRDSASDADLTIAEVFSVMPGTRDLEIVLPRAAPIRGRVVDAKDQGLAGVSVTFGAQGGGIRRVVDTSADGSFSIPVGTGAIVDLEAVARIQDQPGRTPAYPPDDTDRVARMSGVAAGTVDVVLKLPRYP